MVVAAQVRQLSLVLSLLQACSEEDRDAWLEILHGTRGAESASTYERSSIESTSLGDTPSSPAVG